MFGNLAVRGEVGGAHGDSVGAKLGCHHATHRVSAASTGAEVRADAIFGTSVAAGAVTLAAVQPVEHHDRKLLDGAVAQNACRVFRIDTRGAFLVSLDPDGVGKRSDGIEADEGCGSGLCLGKSFCADEVRTDGLLEVDVKVIARSLDACNEPAAILLFDRDHRRTVTVGEEHLRVCVGPRGKERDELQAVLGSVLAGILRVLGIVLARVSWIFGILRIVLGSLLRVVFGLVCEIPIPVSVNVDYCRIGFCVELCSRNSGNQVSFLAGAAPIDGEIFLGNVIGGKGKSILDVPALSTPCSFYSDIGRLIVVISRLYVIIGSHCRRYEQTEQPGCSLYKSTPHPIS